MLIFAGVLAPALGFLNVYPFRYSFVYDHFQYHASLVLIVLAAAGAARAGKELPVTWRSAAKVAAAAVLGVLALLTFQQGRIYENLETLYRDTIAKNPTGATAHMNLGLHLAAEGRVEEALRALREALRLAPVAPRVHYNYGKVLMGLDEGGEVAEETLYGRNCTLQAGRLAGP